MHAGLTEAVTLQIRDDPTGGDCAFFAAWNAKTKTCTLTADLEDPVEISSNGVTLDGNGYAIRGTPSEGPYVSGAGVNLNGVTGVTVTHVTVENFYEGIYLDGVTNATIMHNTLANNHESIELESSSLNEIIGNVSYLSEFGIELEYSGNNWIIGNIDVGGCCTGIYLGESNDNHIIGNELGQKGETGIRIINSHSNTVAGNSVSDSKIGMFINPYCEEDILINNNLMNNTEQAVVLPSVVGGENTFAGNYWSDYDSPEEGCYDGNGDGICDDPYLIFVSETLLVQDASARVKDTTVAANATIAPNLLTEGSKGNWVTASIEVPGYDPGGITVGSVMLVTDKGYVWANETSAAAGNHVSGGVLGLRVKFDRELVMKILNPDLNEGVITGALAENTFQGRVRITLK
jgi:parallel beta-helix repeat protein